MKIKLIAKDKTSKKAFNDILKEKNSFKMKVVAKVQQISKEPLTITISPRGMSKVPLGLIKKSPAVIQAGIEEIFKDYNLDKKSYSWCVI